MKKEFEEIILSENFTNNEDFNNDENYSFNEADEVQSLIKRKMQEDEISEYGYDFANSENYSFETGNAKDNQPQKTEKKYVVLIKPENIDFFESLSPEKRNETINAVISAYQQDKNLPEKERLKKHFKHLLVVIITIAIGFPLVFYLTNASIEATVNSYRSIQGNFEKLYQQKGGVKRNKIQNLQY